MSAFALANASLGWDRTGSVAWFARHELLLVWRDWMSMMTAGKTARERIVMIGLFVFIAGLHGLAYGVLSFALDGGVTANKTTLITLGSMVVLSFSLMLSQAIELITRAFYSRADLDLILSSPASAQRLFAVRISAIVFSTAGLSLCLATPFINMAVVMDGAHWLVAYPALLAMAAIATALGLVATVAMFRTIGLRYTRLAAQIIAAVVGAGFLIGTQVAAILYFGSYSRGALFSSESFVATMPDADSPLWLPARAFLGDGWAAAMLVAIGIASVVAAIAAYGQGFAGWVVQAAGLSQVKTRRQNEDRGFRPHSARRALRAKEWQLLKRDPWLVSQSLMQLLYLIPPAVLLWQNFGDHAGALIILVPVLVMATGQLAGGLAWLAVSGEDAHDLVATAPLPRGAIMIAKIEAVLGLIALLVGPLLIAVSFANAWAALTTAIGAACASAAAVAIQVWHKTESSRSNFRRRQTASRASTFCEAFSSIMWCGATLLTAASYYADAVLFASLALAVLWIAWYISPAADA